MRLGSIWIYTDPGNRSVLTKSVWALVCFRPARKLRSVFVETIERANDIEDRVPGTGVAYEHWEQLNVSGRQALEFTSDFLRNDRHVKRPQVKVHRPTWRLDGYSRRRITAIGYAFREVSRVNVLSRA
jgi:hypothetical protein